MWTIKDYFPFLKVFQRTSKKKHIYFKKYLRSFLIARHLIGEGNGTPLRYSCLENPMDEGAW